MNILLKPASSLCNMRCRYCFYSGVSSVREKASYGIMPAETADAVIDNVFKDSGNHDRVTFAFQGGEPSLAGLEWYKRFTKKASSYSRNCRYAFQTNGLLLDDAWCDFFLEHNVLAGISIDPGRRFHDRNRFSDAGGGAFTSGTFSACMNSKNLLEKKGAQYNVLCVLTSDLAKEPEKAWRFIINERIRYIQFIPCLDPPPEAQPDPKLYAGNTLRPALFAQFYTRLFPWWIRELEQGNYISIKLFDDIANYFFKGVTTSCGIDGKCRLQYVVESDGSVYPCDFYAFDHYKLGNLAESSPGDLLETPRAREFLISKPELPKICGSCRFLSACNGGCKRMRNIMYTGEGAAICGFRILLEKCLAPLERAVRNIHCHFSNDSSIKARISIP